MRRCMIILIIVLMIFCTTKKEDTLHNIPDKVYAKGKPKRIKKKTMKSKYEYLGEYTLTAYCGCSKCSGGWGSKTATGTKCKAEHTVAIDPKIIPYGTKLKINDKIYVAEDCGGGIKGKHIDIYFDSHTDALRFGRQKAKVYLKKPPKLISKLKRIKAHRYAKRGKKNG